MNIDISNAHCGPRIQFPDHAWLRVVLVTKDCLRHRARARPPASLDAPHSLATTLRCAAMSASAASTQRAPHAYGVRANVGRSPDEAARPHNDAHEHARSSTVETLLSGEAPPSVERESDRRSPCPRVLLRALLSCARVRAYTVVRASSEMTVG